MHGPGERPGENAPSNGDQDQHAPATSGGETTVNGEHRSDPRNGGEYENPAVKKTASEGHRGPCAKQDNEKNSKAYPGINTEIKAGVAKRQGGAGERTKHQPKRCGSAPHGVRT